jgi:hypothetical protein
MLAAYTGTAGEVRVDLAEALRIALARGLPTHPLTLRIQTDGAAPVQVVGIALEERRAD